MANKVLQNAKNAKKDEYYTQLVDIELELKHYRHHFQDKVVFCNCDDPYESNFFKYFALNFNKLGLKKLIATCYDGSPVLGNELLLDFGFTTDDPKKVAYKVEITEVKDYNGDGAINLADVAYLMQNDKNVISILKGNGDFRSQECIELLKEADIIVTNPPFSLFREYLAQLVEYKKQFLILGNKNSLTYKEVFKLIQENKLWIGYRNINQDMWFIVPENEEKIVNGLKVRHIMACWYTNLDLPKRHEELVLFKQYSSDEYPRYENYDAINVDKVTDIPCDYYDIIGVPITFMDKYNPDQFDIIALGIVGSCEFLNNRKMEILDKSGKPTGKFTYNAKGTLYKKYNPKVDKSPAFKDVETGELYASIYARILIRRKK